MADLKKMSILVLDNGFFLPFAQKMTQYFGTVYYHCETHPEYPQEKDSMTGYGLEGIEVVTNMWEVIDEVDLIAAPDVFWGDMIEYLRSKNYLCWGGGLTEQLETNRLFLKNAIKNLKLPVNDFKQIQGIDKLRAHLEKNDDLYIKSDTRGDMESFHHETYKLTEPYLNELEHELGAGSKVFPFTVEAPIVAVEEVGIDTYIIDGEHPKIVTLGVEQKDQSYAGYVKPYSDLPKTVTQCVDALAPLMRKGKYRQFFSTECRVTDKKESFLIDCTCRLGSPTGGMQLEIIGNLGEVIYKGAQGILVEPEYLGKYCVELFLRSSFACTAWLPVFIPKGEEQWYKLRNLCKIKDVYYIIPHMTEMAEIGTVVAIGDSLEECLKLLKKRCEAIEGYCIEYDFGQAEKAVKALEEAINKKII
jgi:hypothetical protein